MEFNKVDWGKKAFDDIIKSNNCQNDLTFEINSKKMWINSPDVYSRTMLRELSGKMTWIPRSCSEKISSQFEETFGTSSSSFSSSSLLTLLL